MWNPSCIFSPHCDCHQLVGSEVKLSELVLRFPANQVSRNKMQSRAYRAAIGGEMDAVLS